MKNILILSIFSMLLTLSSCGDQKRSRDNDGLGQRENDAVLNQAILDNLLDYVKAYYVKAYIDKKVGKDFIKAKNEPEYMSLKNNSFYFPTKKIELRVVILALPTAYTVSDVTEDVRQKTNDFYELVIEKKRIDKNLSKQEIINDLLELPESPIDYKNYLADATKRLRDELERENFEGLFDTKNPEEGFFQPNIDIQNNDNTSNKASTFTWIISIIFILLIIGFIYVFFKKQILDFFKSIYAKTKKSDEIDYQKKYREIKTEYLRLSHSLKIYEQDNEQLRTANKQLKVRIKELEQQNRQKTEDIKDEPQFIITSTEKDENEILDNATHLYADAIIDGVFYRISEYPNEDTVFELLKSPSAKTARFRVYHEAYKRVIKNPDFVDGCDKQKTNPLPQTLEVENGEALQDESGKWRISRKAKIRFV